MNALDLTVDQWKAKPESERPMINGITNLVSYLSGLSGALPAAGVVKLSCFIRENGEAMTEASEINPILFNIEPEAPGPASAPVSVEDFMKQHTSELDLLSGGSLADSVSECENMVETLTTEVEHRYTSYNEWVDSLVREELRLKALKEALESGAGRDYTFITDFINGDKFFQFMGKSDGVFYYYTREPITMRHYNPAADVDVSVNLGQMAVHFYPNPTDVRVKPLYGNVFSKDGYYHPHLSREGKICWGNRKLDAQRKLSSGDISGYLSLLESLLKTYSDSAPYIGITKLQLVTQDIGTVRQDSDLYRGVDWLNHPIKSNLIPDYVNVPSWDTETPIPVDDYVIAFSNNRYHFARVIGSVGNSYRLIPITLEHTIGQTTQYSSSNRVRSIDRMYLKPLTPELQLEYVKAQNNGILSARQNKIAKGTKVRILKHETFKWLNGQTGYIVKNENNRYSIVVFRDENEDVHHQFKIQNKDLTPLPSDYFPQSKVSRWIDSYEQTNRRSSPNTHHSCPECSRDFDGLYDYRNYDDETLSCGNCGYLFGTQG